MTAEAVVRAFTAHPGEDPAAMLTEAVVAANTEVWGFSRTRNELNGMGTDLHRARVKDGTSCWRTSATLARTWCARTAPRSSPATTRSSPSWSRASS
jgi:hypothetical protein